MKNIFSLKTALFISVSFIFSMSSPQDNLRSSAYVSLVLWIKVMKIESFMDNLRTAYY